MCVDGNPRLNKARFYRRSDLQIGLSITSDLEIGPTTKAPHITWGRLSVCRWSLPLKSAAGVCHWSLPLEFVRSGPKGHNMIAQGNALGT